jgi:hypothetical protein
MLWLELDKRSIGTNTNVIYGCIYRRPGTDINIFNDKLSTILDTVRKEKKIVYHVGDFNIDLLKHLSHPPTSDFISLNFANSISPLINKPTRITKDTASLIDNIFSNNTISENDISGIIPSDISDHLPIFNIHYHDMPSTIPIQKKKRDYCEKKNPQI